MKQKEEEVKTGFQSLNERLKSFAFIQVHRSYCVNPDYIYQISADTVLLDQGRAYRLAGGAGRRSRKNILNGAEVDDGSVSGRNHGF